MAIRPEAPARRSIRLPDFDYSTPGAYFVTICADRRQMLFDSPTVRVAIEESWLALPDHFANVTSDAFVIMPNHIHGIVLISDTATVVAQHAAPPDPPTDSKPTLGVIVRSFKSAATKRYRELTKRMNALWQPNYYERVVRNDDELNRIRGYIISNPLNWKYDFDNPDRQVNRAYDKRWDWVESGRPEAQHAARLRTNPTASIEGTRA